MMSNLCLLADQLYTFVGHTGEVKSLTISNSESSQGFKRVIMVVGKEHCFETNRELPIGSVSEAARAAKMIEDVSPFKGKRFFVVERLDPHRSLVTFCTIRQDVYDAWVDRIWFILPEPILMRLSLSFTPGESSSVLSTAIEQRSVSAELIGTNFRCQVSSGANIEGKLAYPDFVSGAVNRISSYLAVQIFNFERVKLWGNGFKWKSIVAISASVFVGYLALSSVWLLWFESHLKAQIASQGRELDAVFALQDELNKKENVLAAWEKERKGVHLVSPVWLIFTGMIEQGVEIMSFSITGDEVVLRGKVTKATDVLRYLSEQPSISMPESISPVVNSRRKELFSIRFQLLKLEKNQ